MPEKVLSGQYARRFSVVQHDEGVTVTQRGECDLERLTGAHHRKRRTHVSLHGITQ